MYHSLVHEISTLSSNYLIGGHVSSVSQLHAVIARNKIVHDSPQKSLSQKHIDLFVDSLFHNIICSVATYLVQISSFCTNKYKMAVLTLAQVFFIKVLCVLFSFFHLLPKINGKYLLSEIKNWIKINSFQYDEVGWIKHIHRCITVHFEHKRTISFSLLAFSSLYPSRLVGRSPRRWTGQ